VEVSQLAVYLHEHGHTIVCPLLPGHGTKIEDLRDITWEDWTQHAEQELRALQRNCPFVFVGGISLGGLISLYLGIHYPEIKGLLIYSPALCLRNRWAFLSTVLKFIVKEVPKHRGPANKSIVDQHWQGYSLDSLPAISQLLELQRLIRKGLSRISQPIVIFQGINDETIDPKCASEIFAKVNSTDRAVHKLENSAHSLLLDREWDKIAQASEAFVERIVAQGN
jgi:carboxylesterase